jgi:hypothetical protein
MNEPSPYLSPAELYELTEARQPTKQAEVLRKRGFRFTVTKYGRVRLLRAHRDRKLGATDAPAVERVEPDFRHVA